MNRKDNFSHLKVRLTYIGGKTINVPFTDIASVYPNLFGNLTIVRCGDRESGIVKVEIIYNNNKHDDNIKKSTRRANTFIQKAADFFRIIDEDSYTRKSIRNEMVQRWKDLQVLRRYQAYRRGKGSIAKRPSSCEISEVLERVIRELKSHFRD